MASLGELRREYERAHFPADRRLDLHGEAPRMARERALRWIQSRAHEAPGQELLLIVERAVQPGRRPSAVAEAIRELLTDLNGKLLAGWHPFGPGSVALRIADFPSILPLMAPARSEGDGRTNATSGAARPPPEDDIPAELLELATRTAELRIEREGLSSRVLDVILREVWIEAQAAAMETRTSFAAGLERVHEAELDRMDRG
ncbi:MAG TPA: hypothetical protein VMN39_04510 [Longimicrobiaceae bacterium]|nr:hypothetical protein [Longimicrobiaceae bacterium]